MRFCPVNASNIALAADSGKRIRPSRTAQSARQVDGRQLEARPWERHTSQSEGLRRTYHGPRRARGWVPSTCDGPRTATRSQELLKRQLVLLDGVAAACRPSRTGCVRKGSGQLTPRPKLSELSVPRRARAIRRRSDRRSPGPMRPTLWVVRAAVPRRGEGRGQTKVGSSRAAGCARSTTRRRSPPQPALGTLAPGHSSVCSRRAGACLPGRFAVPCGVTADALQGSATQASAVGTGQCAPGCRWRIAARRTSRTRRGLRHGTPAARVPAAAALPVQRTAARLHQESVCPRRGTPCSRTVRCEAASATSSSRTTRRRRILASSIRAACCQRRPNSGSADRRAARIRSRAKERTVPQPASIAAARDSSWHRVGPAGRRHVYATIWRGMASIMGALLGASTLLRQARQGRAANCRGDAAERRRRGRTGFTSPSHRLR